MNIGPRIVGSVARQLTSNPEVQKITIQNSGRTFQSFATVSRETQIFGSAEKVTETFRSTYLKPNSNLAREPISKNSQSASPPTIHATNMTGGDGLASIWRNCLNIMRGGEFQGQQIPKEEELSTTRQDSQSGAEKAKQHEKTESNQTSAEKLEKPRAGLKSLMTGVSVLSLAYSIFDMLQNDEDIKKQLMVKESKEGLVSEIQESITKDPLKGAKGVGDSEAFIHGQEKISSTIESSTEEFLQSAQKNIHQCSQFLGKISGKEEELAAEIDRLSTIDMVELSKSKSDLTENLKASESRISHLKEQLAKLQADQPGKQQTDKILLQTQIGSILSEISDEEELAKYDHEAVQRTDKQIESTQSNLAYLTQQKETLSSFRENLNKKIEKLTECFVEVEKSGTKSEKDELLTQKMDDTKQNLALVKNVITGLKGVKAILDVSSGTANELDTMVKQQLDSLSKNGQIGKLFTNLMQNEKLKKCLTFMGFKHVDIIKITLTATIASLETYQASHKVDEQALRSLEKELEVGNFGALGKKLVEGDRSTIEMLQDNIQGTVLATAISLGYKLPGKHINRVALGNPVGKSTEIKDRINIALLQISDVVVGAGKKAASKSFPEEKDVTERLNAAIEKGVQHKYKEHHDALANVEEQLATSEKFLSSL